MKTAGILLVSASAVLYATLAYAGIERINSVPTLGEWGMVSAAVVLGAAGLYTIFKK